MVRLTDNDKRFLCFTYGKCTWWNPLSIEISSGDREESNVAKNTLTFYAFGWIARTYLPNIIRPHVKKNKAGWDEATVKRMGRDWYETTTARRYGFMLNDGTVSLNYGPAFDHWPNPYQYRFDLPWMHSRHVRTSYYGVDGSLYFTEVKGMKWDEERKIIDACPTKSFELTDYDGTTIIAKTSIQEREWRKGKKWCKWLSWFVKPTIRRSLSIDFDKETGPEKGSWKGGTTGHGIDMLKGELHEEAMRRYCEQDLRSKYQKYKMTFVGEVKNAS